MPEPRKKLVNFSKTLDKCRSPPKVRKEAHSLPPRKGRSAVIKKLLDHVHFQAWLSDRIQSFISPCTPESLAPWRRDLHFVWHIDLDPFLPPIISCYAATGRPAHDPAAVLRMLLIMHFRHERSLDAFAETLRREPVLCLLCGFELGCSPRAATLRDFLRRLYRKRVLKYRIGHRSRRERLKLKPGEKLPPRHQGIIATIARAALKAMANPTQRGDLIHNELLGTAVKESAKRDLLGDPKALKAAVDGSALYTGANSYGRKICSCQGRCHCERRFCDPDARHGWDSRDHCRFFGYNLYLATAAGTEHNLPIALELHSATRHDATVLPPLLVAFQRLHHDDLAIKELLADAAHDQVPIYELARALAMTPVIDPIFPETLRKGQIPAAPHGVSFNAHGRPQCQEGHVMVPRGHAAKARPRWTCPLANKGSGLTCENPCFFRDHLLVVNDRRNPRLNGPLPFGSDAFDEEYKKRTVVERAYAEIKDHTGLGHTRHRRRYIWLGRATMTAIVLHLKAWLAHAPTDALVPDFFPPLR